MNLLNWANLSLLQYNLMPHETKDYGCDPLGDGKFKMVPSGDIVDAEEKDKRLSRFKRREVKNDCFGLSWDQIEQKQGGKLKR